MNGMGSEVLLVYKNILLQKIKSKQQSGIADRLDW